MRQGLILIVTLMIAAPFVAVLQGQSSSSASDSKMASSDFKHLLTLANSGSTQAQFQLGLAYQYGHGVEQSAYEAARMPHAASYLTHVATAEV
jgi:TPR repeat protein